MANYGEELVYWYLRLNGFFIISNFVLHTKDKRMRGDADLLAIRLPKTKEYIWVEINKHEVPREVLPDGELFNYIDENKIVGIIAEVKAGFDKSSGDLNIFSNKERFTKALQRLGMYEDGIENESWHIRDIDNKYQVIKILFKNNNERVELKDGEYLIISLQHAENFIYKRLEEYSVEKTGSWVFFPSDLLQYLIWCIKFRSR